MKNRIYLTILLLSAIHLPFSFGQNDFWAQLNGAPGGAISSIERTHADGTLYAKNQQGSIFRSEDNGENWTFIFDNNKQEDSIGFVTVSPNGILYGEKWSSVPNRDVYRSADKGDSWELVEAGSEYYNRVETMDGKLYATKYSSFSDTYSIYVSQDNGGTWSFFRGAYPSFALSLKVDQFGHFLVKTGNGDGTHVSQDSGTTWDTITQSIAQDRSLFLPSGKYVLLNFDWELVNGSYKNVYRFVSGALGDPNQTVLNLNPTVDSARYSYFSTPLYLNNGDILISLGKNRYLSHDEGITWEVQQSDVAARYLLTNIPYMGGGKIFATKGNLSTQALHASTDHGFTWSPARNGMYHSMVGQLGLTHNPRTLWASNIDGLFKSLDDGENWIEVLHDSLPIPLSSSPSDFAFDQEDNLYTVQQGQLLISEDAGTTFSDITPPGVGINSWFNLWEDPLSATIFAYLNNNGLYSTNDKGVSWEVLTNLRVDGIARHPSGRLFGLVSESPLFRSLHYSEDNGQTWQLVDAPIDEQVYFMDIDPNGSIYIHSYTTLYRSDDLGVTWHDITPGLNLSDAAFNSNGHLFVFTTNYGGVHDGMLRSNNKGENWTILPWIPREGSDNNIWYRARRLLMDEDGFLYTSLWSENAIDKRLLKTSHSTFDGAYIFGNASMSADEDCTTIDPLLPMNDILIEAEGDNTWYTKTDTLMADYQMFVDTGAYQVTAIPHLPFLWDTCSVNVHLPQNGDTTYVDFSIPAIEECPFITVDLTIPFMERCFENDIYIQYCNHGTAYADSVVIFLQLDTVLSLTDTVLNWQAVPDSIGLFSLTLPSLDINECETIVTPVLVDCNGTQLGETHCITTMGWPDSLCVMPANWSGAEIEADAYCEDSTVVLKLQNVGSATSQPLDFIVVEDDVVLLQDNEEYDPSESIMFSYPSAGNYYRIESEQEPGHPFPGPVSAWEVGCNGSGDSSFVFIHQYSTGDAFGSIDRECAVNAGAYDPNDKQGFPLGYGPDHFIRPLTDIEYLIRFQNTGTAPAHNVIIKDTLSPFFNISSLRVGAASHSFEWGLAGDGELTFSFNNIELPDSNINEAASHGFVSFRISHEQGLPLGTDFFNSAAIYFDFNEPIITNVTHHQLGDDFLETAQLEQVVSENNALHIFPNPAQHATVIEHNGAALLHLYDLHGHLVLVKKIEQPNTFVLLERNGLGDGMYFISMMDRAGNGVGNGKVVFH